MTVILNHLILHRKVLVLVVKKHLGRKESNGLEKIFMVSRQNEILATGVISTCKHDAASKI